MQRASVVIATKNRKVDLLKAVESAMGQRGLLEVVVTKDVPAREIHGGVPARRIGMRSSEKAEVAKRKYKSGNFEKLKAET